MALPAQAIEKIVREPSDTQGAYKRLLLLTISIFIIVVIVYAGLAFGYKAYLASSVSKLEAQIAASANTVSAEDEASIGTFYSQLVNLRTVLGTHRSVSRIFALLERTVAPNVYYTKISLNTSTNELTLSGAARGLADIAAQAALFEKQSEVDHVNFSNGGVSTGQPWQFTMSVFLKSDVLKGGMTSTAPAVIIPQATSTPASTSTATSSAQ